MSRILDNDEQERAEWNRRQMNRQNRNTALQALKEARRILNEAKKKAS